MRKVILFIGVLALVSCKSTDRVVDVSTKTTISSDVSILSEKANQDTTRTKKVEQTEEFTRIYESELVVEYDTDKGVPSKVTKKEKVTHQGKQVKTDESEERGLNESDKNLWNHYQESEKDVDSKEVVKEESAFGGMMKSMGKWLGLGICVVLFLWMIWNGFKKKLLL